MFGVTERDLVGFECEAGFEDAVLTCRRPLLRKVPEIRAAMVRNALDPSREDQWKWMQRVLALAGLDLAEADGIDLG